MAYECITKSQEDMITMLIEGENITDIAKRLKVTRNTIYAWMKLDNVKAELDKRKQELARQGNQMILKDLNTYITNIKELANDKSDKRVCLAANQYLINRIYGSPTTTIDVNSGNDEMEGQDTDELANELSAFRKRKAK